MKLPALLGVIALAIAPLPRTPAPCDGLDGPVVPAARKALETGNINLLVSVQKPDEAEIKRAFDHAQAVRKLSAEARELADRFFFETIARAHCTGEGAPFTGLKPAGGDLGPAIPAADAALRDGNVDGVLKLLTESLRARRAGVFRESIGNEGFRQGQRRCRPELRESIRRMHPLRRGALSTGDESRARSLPRRKAGCSRLHQTLRSC